MIHEESGLAVGRRRLRAPLRAQRLEKRGHRRTEIVEERPETDDEGFKETEITLRVTDSLGLSGEDTMTLTVYENRPHAAVQRE